MASAIQSAVSSIQSALGTPTQKVLLLGSGFVAKPCLDYLAREGIAITVGMH
jgi:glutamyl-tRNA reductase